jgi:hypothetical protein
MFLLGLCAMGGLGFYLYKMHKDGYIFNKPVAKPIDVIAPVEAPKDLEIK